MKVVEIKDNIVYREYPEYESAEEARKYFASNIQFEDAPNDTFPTWTFDPSKTGDARFSPPPIPEGYAWDDTTIVPTIYNIEDRRAGERLQLHNATSDDTLQALRKIREGDKSMNWEAWLNTLDAYNVAIEDTVKQPTYPNKVVYPPYPEKPRI